MEFLIALLDHPVLLVVILMFVMGFVGMTYEFILRMCGKDPFLDKPSQGNGSANEEPPEPANVPKPDTDPDDELEGAEEIEDEDGNATVEYTYTTDFDKWWESVPKWDERQSKQEDMIEPEGAR